MKIILIEDDPILSLKYQMMLEELGHTLLANCSTISAAREALSTHTPDVILSDIVIGKEMTFSLADFYKQIPTIFMTSFPKEHLQEHAMSFPKSMFLVKPFHKLSLKSILDRLDVENQIKKEIQEKEPKIGIEVIGKYRQKKILPLDNILWVETKGNYSTIVTIEKKYIIKLSLRKISEQLNEHFIQIHKSFIINMKLINRIDFRENNIYINEQPLPVSRNFKHSFLEAFDKL